MTPSGGEGRSLCAQEQRRKRAGLSIPEEAVINMDNCFETTEELFANRSKQEKGSGDPWSSLEEVI